MKINKYKKYKMLYKKIMFKYNIIKDYSDNLSMKIEELLLKLKK